MTTPNDERRWLVLTRVLGAAFFALYSLTWSGRYFHDSVTFLRLIEDGRFDWVHFGYLPIAQSFRVAFHSTGLLPLDRAVGLVSAVSGGLLVMTTARVLRHLVEDPWTSLLAAACLGLTPAVWFGAVHVEIHLFSALGSALALALVTGTSLPMSLRAPLGVFLAAATHMSNLLMAPMLGYFAYDAERRRTGRPPDRPARYRLIAFTAAGMAFARLVATQLPHGQTQGADALIGMIRLSTRWLSAPSALADKLAVDTLWPWALLVPAALLAPFRAPARRRGAAIVAAVSGLTALWMGTTVVFHQAGQFALIASVALAYCLGETLSSLRHPRRWALAAVVLQAAVAIPALQSLTADEDLAWARAAAEEIRLPATVFAFGEYRVHRLRSLTEAEVQNFAAATDGMVQSPGVYVLDCARSRAAAGKRLYIDPLGLRKGRKLAGLLPLIDAIKKNLVTRRTKSGSLLEVVGLRDE